MTPHRPRIVVATGNAGKLRELAEAFAAHGIDSAGLDALDRHVEPPEETEETFEANARLKAEAYSLHTPCVVVADDSGLVVDALGGAPGVHSARYGGPGLTDADRNHKLLEAMREVPDGERSARFCCVLAVASGGTTLATFEGVIEGRIVYEPRGEGGFGYDPVFFHPESGCTTAELSTEAKRRVSHRGRAIAALVEAIRADDPRLASALSPAD